MGELTLDPEVIQVIDNYMERPREPDFCCLERICVPTLYYMADEVFMNKCVRNRPVLKGKPFKENKWDRKYDYYFKGSMALKFIPYHMGRCRWGYTYFLHGKCENYVEEHSKEIVLVYLRNRWNGIENAIMSTKCFLELYTDFTEWFEERRKGFLKEMDAAIAEIKKFQMSEKPQSHGGVANLLKVLTKTMEKQGADITNIAKVQYAVCIQAGIYIPDEFVQDVAVAMDVLEDKEGKGDADC